MLGDDARSYSARTTANGQRVWRQIKRGTAGFSIGYLAKQHPRRGGGFMLTEIDLLEISAVSKPAHPATMALSWKTADNRNGIPSVIPSVEDLRRRERSLGLGVKDEAYAHTLAVLGHQPARPTRTAAKSIDTRPIRVASFEC